MRLWKCGDEAAARAPRETQSSRILADAARAHEHRVLRRRRRRDGLRDVREDRLGVGADQYVGDLFAASSAIYQRDVLVPQGELPLDLGDGLRPVGDDELRRRAQRVRELLADEPDRRAPLHGAHALRPGPRRRHRVSERDVQRRRVRRERQHVGPVLDDESQPLLGHPGRVARARPQLRVAAHALLFAARRPVLLAGGRLLFRPDERAAGAGHDHELLPPLSGGYSNIKLFFGVSRSRARPSRRGCGTTSRRTLRASAPCPGPSSRGSRRPPGPRPAARRSRSRARASSGPPPSRSAESRRPPSSS